MAIETVEQARALFERYGGRVVRATLHEDAGDRQVWFVGHHGWCYLTSDEMLITYAREERSGSLVADSKSGIRSQWPIEGSGEWKPWPFKV